MSNDKNKFHRAVGPLALAVTLALGAAGVQAADKMHEGRLTDSEGNAVLTGSGECWQAVGGVDKMMERCGDKMPVAVDGDEDGDGVPDSRDKCPGTPKGAKVDADGCEIMADMVINVTAEHFDFDSAELKPAMRAVGDEIVAKVKASKGDERLHIIGYTDSTGPEAYNLGLSERRAQAVANWLIQQGIPADHITTTGMGEANPIADNSTREGRSMNRRVQVMTK
jgi:outer membrane protein OmpA-like peptidoglycan-associated protein